MGMFANMLCLHNIGVMKMKNKTSKSIFIIMQILFLQLLYIVAAAVVGFITGSIFYGIIAIAVMYIYDLITEKITLLSERAIEWIAKLITMP